MPAVGSLTASTVVFPPEVVAMTQVQQVKQHPTGPEPLTTTNGRCLPRLSSR